MVHVAEPSNTDGKLDANFGIFAAFAIVTGWHCEPFEWHGWPRVLTIDFQLSF